MLCFAKTLRVLSCTLYETDASLVKRFAITERHQVQFRAEAYNLFNHPNFGFTSSNLNLNNPATFGKFSQTIGTQTSSGSTRTLQLAPDCAQNGFNDTEFGTRLD
jgi:hypothetical protein